MSFVVEDETAVSDNAPLKGGAIAWLFFVLELPVKYIKMEDLSIGGSGIISVKEARKLLGSSYDNMPDENVELVISDMATLAARLIEWQNCSTKSKGVL